MSDEFQLNAELRTDVGKGASRRLRRLSDLVPAIIYGAGKETTTITFTHKDLQKAIENEAFFSHIITINIGSAADQVILKDLQRHPAKPRLLHADFMRVSSDQEIRVNVPLHFINQESCVGVKTEGGSISRLLTEVEIVCLPGDLPEFIEVDMEEIALGESVRLSDLLVPEGSSLTANLDDESGNLSVASVHTTRAVEEDVVDEEDAEGLPADEEAAGDTDAEADSDADDKEE